MLLLQTLAAARKTIRVTSPYFVPDAAVRQVLTERAAAGVDVRLLLPGEHTDARMVQLASQRHYQELLEAGVRIWEYQGTFIHSKTAVADGVWSLVGSANMDIRSLEHNHENMLGILDPGLGAALEASFGHDLERAREIDRRQWQPRDRVQRVKERLAALFAKQY